MSKQVLILITLLIIFAGLGYFAIIRPTQEERTQPVSITETKKEITATSTQQQSKPQPQKIMPFTISSPSFPQNGTIPKLFTCDGRGISPELDFAGIPEGTRSLALTMEDPDVPHSVRADGMWNHWVVWNMPATTTKIAEGGVPPGVTGVNTSGKNAYAAPCPPDREHRYIFTLYALDAMIPLPQGSTKEELLQALASHIIGKAELVGLYNRH